MPRGKYPDTKDWRDKIKIGDVLAEGSGTLRVVVNISPHPKAEGFIGYVYFSIRKRSWTNRCYTLVSRVDLKQRGFHQTPFKLKRFSKLLKLVAHDTIYSEKYKLRLTASDVVGIL